MCIPAVLSMHTVKPLDSSMVFQAAIETRRILCVEEHRTPGVLFSSVASLLVQHHVSCMVEGLNLGEGIMQTACEQSTYLALMGLDAESIAEKCIDLISKSQ